MRHLQQVLLGDAEQELSLDDTVNLIIQRFQQIQGTETNYEQL